MHAQKSLGAELDPDLWHSRIDLLSAQLPHDHAESLLKVQFPMVSLLAQSITDEFLSLCHTGGMVGGVVWSSASEDASDHRFPLCLRPCFPDSMRDIICFSWPAFHGSESPGVDAAVPAPSLV